ncbi:hypothetical protein MA16_Dca028460 [Dendrobium catenatum]|uniref:Uncharacterized protein n=1 Tax=Dendrobium catenatum TaxID=906689 RepID=A0A2I0VBR4_9ASPA|nr:hypothetical protein MA16_Dca028460 [Dendrobium catenatum]
MFRLASCNKRILSVTAELYKYRWPFLLFSFSHSLSLPSEILPFSPFFRAALRLFSSSFVCLPGLFLERSTSLILPIRVSLLWHFGDRALRSVRSRLAILRSLSLTTGIGFRTCDGKSLLSSCAKCTPWDYLPFQLLSHYSVATERQQRSGSITSTKSL